MWACAPCGAWSRLPLEGENQEDEADRLGRECELAPKGQAAGRGRRRHVHSLRMTVYFVKSLYFVQIRIDVGFARPLLRLKCRGVKSLLKVQRRLRGVSLSPAHMEAVKLKAVAT